MSSIRISRFAKDRGRLYFSGKQKHHKFSQTKWARKLYGRLLDDPRNIQIVLAEENISHAGKSLIFWDEQEFCRALNIEPRSEEARRRKQRELNAKPLKSERSMK